MRNIHLLLLLVFVIDVQAQPLPFNNPNLSPNERATDLMNRLTLTEKVSLMMHTAPAIPRFQINEYKLVERSFTRCWACRIGNRLSTSNRISSNF